MSCGENFSLTYKPWTWYSEGANREESVTVVTKKNGKIKVCPHCKALRPAGSESKRCWTCKKRYNRGLFALNIVLLLSLSFGAVYLVYHNWDRITEWDRNRNGGTDRPQNHAVLQIPSVPRETESHTNQQPQELSFGDTFTFLGLEMIFHPEIEFIISSTARHSARGKTVIKIPVTAKRVDGDGANWYNPSSLYNPQGFEMEKLTDFSIPESISRANVRQGTEVSGDYYILYEGDGDYFATWGSHGYGYIEIKLPIYKDSPPE